MDKLSKGILEFQHGDFETQRDLFSQLGRQQKPHTLFIGCSDSRVVPTLITKTSPGELFMVRNVANIVPHYERAEQDSGTAAAIEYAVMVLNVSTIVVCGHSNCGGCAALSMEPEQLEHLPITRQWLTRCGGVTEQVAKLLAVDSSADPEQLTEQVNVKLQLSNLLTYPYIAERVQAQTLKLSGWHYLIDSGVILHLDHDTGQFEKVT